MVIVCAGVGVAAMCGRSTSSDAWTSAQRKPRPTDWSWLHPRPVTPLLWLDCQVRGLLVHCHSHRCHSHHYRSFITNISL